MSDSIIIIDTSVFLNILEVPNKCQDKAQIIQEFKEYITLDAFFILPMATIIETGNHIAQSGDGNVRRETAKKFCEHIVKVINGDAPYKISNFPSNDEIKSWINDFPNLAGRNKSNDTGKDKKEGTSFGDLTIIQEFEKQTRLHKNYEIWIWSLDRDLKSKHYIPTKI